MNKTRKKRLAPRDAKRLRTIRATMTREEISASARKGGLASPTKYDSDRGREAVNRRWAKYRERKAQEALEKGE